MNTELILKFEIECTDKERDKKEITHRIMEACSEEVVNLKDEGKMITIYASIM